LLAASSRSCATCSSFWSSVSGASMGAGSMVSLGVAVLLAALAGATLDGVLAGGGGENIAL
jgi:hypothetical protein